MAGFSRSRNRLESSTIPTTWEHGIVSISRHWPMASRSGHTARAIVSFTITHGSRPTHPPRVNARPRTSACQRWRSSHRTPHRMNGPPPGSCGRESRPGTRRTSIPSSIERRTNDNGSTLHPRHGANTGERLLVEQRLSQSLALSALRRIGRRWPASRTSTSEDAIRVPDPDGASTRSRGSARTAPLRRAGRPTVRLGST